MNTIDLEQRLAVLEQEFRAFKGLLNPQSVTKDWRATFGTFADDPGFDEILRLGRELREQDRQVQTE